jgi:UDP-N-acetylmuramate--alanine ligase
VNAPATEIAAAATSQGGRAGLGPLERRGRLHFVGVAGSGMSGLAAMLASSGRVATGEDASFDLSGSSGSGPASSDRARLEHLGVSVPPAAESASAIAADPPAAVIASAAVSPEHPSLKAARAAGVPILSYAQALGELQRDRTSICIAGTHGKSTTTSLLGHLLVEAGLDPSVIVGARCRSFGAADTARGLGNARVGADRVPHGPLAGRPGLLVSESCEYRRSFLNHHPAIALVNNVEEDHLDAYADLDEIVEAFAAFAQRLPEDGCLLIHNELAQRERVTRGLATKVETFGDGPDADWRVSTRDDGWVLLDGTEDRRLRWRSPMAGKHSAHNAAAAAILALRLGMPEDRVVAGLENFPGVERRMETLGRRRVADGEVLVVDDYGHHPTECRATLEALRRHHRPRRLLCIFQPHQHSRTRFLLDRFAESFDAADLVLVPEIHFVRDSEEERRRVSSADLVSRLQTRGVASRHLSTSAEIVACLEATAAPGDLVVTMGAGPVDRIARAWLAAGEAT